MNVSELLCGLPELQHTTEEDVRRVVGSSISSRGPRFELRDGPKEDGGSANLEGPVIRAKYRHPKQEDGRWVRPRGYGYGTCGSGNGRGPALWNARCGPSSGSSLLSRGRQPGFSRPPLAELPRAGDDDDEDDARQMSGTRGPEEDSGLVGPAAKPAHVDKVWQRSQGRSSSSKDAGSSEGNAPGRGGQQQACPGKPTAEAADAAETTDGKVQQQRPAALGAEVADAETTDGKVRVEVWERYYEPGSHRTWFWNEATEEVFFADDAASGWERFEDAEGRPWWWNEATGCFFFEEE